MVRTFCVGRNYAAHAAEMSNAMGREAPSWFTESCLSLIPSGSTLPDPPGARDHAPWTPRRLALGNLGPVLLAVAAQARRSICDRPNTTPRSDLGGRTPAEAIRQELLASNESSSG